MDYVLIYNLENYIKKDFFELIPFFVVILWIFSYWLKKQKNEEIQKFGKIMFYFSTLMIISSLYLDIVKNRKLRNIIDKHDYLKVEGKVTNYILGYRNTKKVQKTIFYVNGVKFQSESYRGYTFEKKAKLKNGINVKIYYNKNRIVQFWREDYHEDK